MLASDIIYEFFGDNVEVIMTRDDKPLYNANQIGECLGIRNINDNIRDLETEDYIKVNNRNIGTISRDSYNRVFNNAGQNFLTEAGLYTIIMMSRKPKAKKIARLLIEEVLVQDSNII